MAFTEGLCPPVNRAIELLFPTGVLQFRPAGVLDALTSPYNTDGFEVIPIDNGNGTRKKVKMVFLPSFCVTDFQTSKPDICGAGTVKPLKDKEVDITKAFYSKVFQINRSDMELLCSPDPTRYKADFMMRLMGEAGDALDIELGTDLATKFGNFYGTGSNAAVSVDILQSDSSANYPGMAVALQHYEDIGGNRPPIIVGGGNIALFNSYQKIACCNTNQGINMQFTNGSYAFFKDLHTNTTLGANQFAMWIPGAFQFVTFNEYRGVGDVQAGVLEMGTIVDPVRSFEWDIKVVLDSCGEFWKLVMGIHYELVPIPATLNPCGDMTGVTGSLRFIGAKLP